MDDGKKCKYRDPQPAAVRILGITETTENISFDTVPIL
jgi:hypothetical protein